MKTNKKEIKNLKGIAKSHYVAYCLMADKYDCGLKLTEYLLPDMIYHKIKFNEAMDKLAELDPDTPKTRL
jgi:hypothetical protein